jgi:hypothetical protein
LIDVHKWHAVWDGCFSYSIIERAKYWTYEDDIDFWIACEIKKIYDKIKNASS